MQYNVFFFPFLYSWGPFSGHGIPDVPSLTWSVPCRRLPFPHLMQICGIPLNSILPSTPRFTHLPSSSVQNVSRFDIIAIYEYFFSSWRDSPLVGLGLLMHEDCRGFEITQRHTTVGRTPLDEWSARRRDLYLKQTTLTTDSHPCPRWDSNPQSQQASDRIPTP